MLKRQQLYRCDHRHHHRCRSSSLIMPKNLRPFIIKLEPLSPRQDAIPKRERDAAPQLLLQHASSSSNVAAATAQKQPLQLQKQRWFPSHRANLLWQQLSCKRRCCWDTCLHALLLLGCWRLAGKASPRTDRERSSLWSKVRAWATMTVKVFNVNRNPQPSSLHDDN